MPAPRYYGDDLTTAEYDRLAIEAVGEKLLLEEANLFGVKWFDYRHLHPTSATYLYAHHYTEEYRKIYQKIYDVDRGKYATGSKGKDAMMKMETAGFWKGRQSADRLGIPYPAYIGSVLRFLVDGNIWQRIPRPTHLYSTKAIDAAIADWQGVLNAGLFEPEIDHLNNNDAHSIQCRKDIERWVCERLQQRRHPEFGLSHYLFKKRLVTEESALKYFNSQIVNAARRIATEW